MSAVHNYNHRDVHLRRPYIQFATPNTNASTGRQTVLGDGLLNIATGSTNLEGASYININYELADKVTPSYTVTPKFEYKRGNLLLDGAASFSRARNIYDDHGNVAFAGVGPLRGIGISASRPDLRSGGWSIAQTSGPDWSDLGSYLNPRTAASGTANCSCRRESAGNGRRLTRRCSGGWRTLVRSGCLVSAGNFEPFATEPEFPAPPRTPFIAGKRTGTGAGLQQAGSETL